MNKKTQIYYSLLPLSWIYGVGVRVRNALFNQKILSSETFDVPVISIGNLRVGGTGKTPHTEYLIRLLQDKYRIAILSRGYKRKSSGFVLADEQANAETIGDESYQLFRKFPSILVAVDSNRRRGIRNLLDLPETVRPEVILLDDAYQHRYVKPSLSILLTEYGRPFSQDALLPAGRLREPAKNKNRADIIIVTKCPTLPDEKSRERIIKELDPAPHQKVFFSTVGYSKPQPVFPETHNCHCELDRNCEAIDLVQSPPIPSREADQKVCHCGLDPQSPAAWRGLTEFSDSALLFSGIASPNSFIEYVKTIIPQVKTKLYPDHHNYTKANFEQLQSSFDNLPGNKKILITTEKDMVKIIAYSDFPNKLKPYLCYIPIEIRFDDIQKNQFNEIIENHVRTIERNSRLA